MLYRPFFHQAPQLWSAHCYDEQSPHLVYMRTNLLTPIHLHQQKQFIISISLDNFQETEKLEAEQSRLESEIQSLQQEKDQLEFILQAHQPLCKVEPSRPSTIKVKVEPGAHPSNCGGCSHASHENYCPMPENLSMSASAASSSAATSASSSQGALEASAISSRPNSLPLIKRDRARMLSMSSATGVTINTPTSGVTITPSSLFCPGLDSMVDGSTGLTPLTGMSCSSQVQRNSSDSGSEAVGSPTLISL